MSEETDKEETISRADLLELVKAIKFAKPNASIRNVHKEITQVLSKTKDSNGNESYACLATVTLNDVKKVWKKAMQQTNSNTNTSAENRELMKKLPDGVVQVYTVGNGSIQTLAQDYTAAAAAEAASKEQELAQLQQDELNKYIHVFADVPADRSGSRPHQALISFHKQKTTTDSSTKQDIPNVCKIQMAASEQGDEEKYPMLLYNQDRSVRTFIHPDEEDCDGGYDKIQSWIREHGVGGALGTMGGTKAYFYYRMTKRRNGPSVISLKITELAPPQEW